MTTSGGSTPLDDALDFILFCDGVEDGGQVAYARRGRVIARALIETIEALDAERSARIALQRRIDTLERILLNHTLVEVSP